jgi:L-prolyl-PCP dehydrogenase
MDFSFDPEQLSYKKSVLEFARNELVRDVIPLDRNSDFDREGFLQCARFGIQGLPIPEQYGGSAADPLTVVVAMEALGYACKDNGLLFSINAQMWSFELPILEFGSEQQKMRYLPRLCSGEMIGVHAMTEPQSGSDAFDLRTEAVGDFAVSARFH